MGFGTRRASEVGDSPRALVLVRNTVSHDARVLREAVTLRDLGYDVLIAGTVSKDEQSTKDRLAGIQVIRLAPMRRVRRRVAQRKASRAGAVGPTAGSDSGVKWAHALLRRLTLSVAYNLQGVALVLRTSPAIVHANDYDTMWIGVAAKLLRRSRLVYDAHELWPDQGLPEWRPWLVACEWLFVRVADAIITVSPGCAAVMAKRYRVPPPVIVRNLPERTIDSLDRVEGVCTGGRPLAVYVGVLAPGRGIEEAIQALALVPQLRLRLIGPDFAGFRPQLERCASAAGVEARVEFRAPVPPEAVAEAIADADLGVVLIQPTCLSYEVSLPNKLFEYIAAGLPVLASDLPVMGELVREQSLGEAVPPNDVAAIAEAMRRLAEPQRNVEVRERVRTFGEHNTWAEERPILEGVYRALRSSAAEVGGA
jgi:glycosyltransferase involved in cell wall biosynthesis